MAHLNITSNIATTYGVTLVAGAEADDCSKTETVEISTVADSASNEIVYADPVNHKRIETQVSGDGPRALSLTAGNVANTATLTVIFNEVNEAPNARPTFTVRAAGHAAFTDPATSISAVGAEPTIADLEITAVEYTVAERVTRSASLTDMVLVGTDGTPAYRETTQLLHPFSIQGRGDLPAGVALGTGGSNFVGADTGKTLVGTLTTGEKRGDWNRWGTDGTRYASA